MVSLTVYILKLPVEREKNKTRQVSNQRKEIFINI